MKRILVRSLRSVFAVTAWTLVVSILWVLVLRFVPPPITWEMAAQAKEQGSVERTWVPLQKISPAMPLAVIAAEDQKFFDHFGFDLEAMQKAFDQNERNSGRMRGASTISQQVAKNVFCWPDRTWMRKGAEAYFTVLIEALWDKERILEVYLNIAETGKGRFGVESTAQHCFNRSAGKLTTAQAALIAAVLPSPRRFNACKPSAFVQRRQAWVQRQMHQLGDLLDPVERQRLQDIQRKKEQRKKRNKRR